MKRLSLCALFLTSIAFVGGCGSSSSSDGGSSNDERMTYDQMVRRIGRPPNRTMSAPDGSRQVTWETNVAGDQVRHLIVTFDPDGKMIDSRTETRPRRVRRR